MLGARADASMDQERQEKQYQFPSEARAKRVVSAGYIYEGSTEGIELEDIV